MKFILIAFSLFILSNKSFAQENEINFLLNEGLATYIDNSKGANYTISFSGDTVIQGEQDMKFFLIGSNMVQIHKWPIPEKMLANKYDQAKELKLLEHFRDYEAKYIQKEVIRNKLKIDTEVFTNKYSKNFLLWQYSQPIDKNEDDGPIVTEAVPPVRSATVTNQLYLLFVTNSYVTMINVPVFNDEKIEEKIKWVKTDVANSIRIYAGDVNSNVLNNQIAHTIKNEPFVINDSSFKIQFTLPFWLNVMEGQGYYLLGTFPDINNISNALLLNFYPTHNFSSFKAFEDKALLGGGIKKIEKVNSTNSEITRYKVFDQSQNGNLFISQYVFIKLKYNYGVINFTATANTYDKNVGRFNEFVNSIVIGK